ncbi:hypothetical protein [Aquisalimonas asiatica]|uniref:Outer membrane protein beta-barrel domain-containing protein n=1 Tax=Aquisalimonas asiatica TaxID=406100 RepID=A0A1H8UFM2_9GAMM|nr:hypothetical protein [Aquisalimonas asiatica]SEP01827.1 hypothetical protein SAMN04488052_106162 [Aquisalimonas asiatica]
MRRTMTALALSSALVAGTAQAEVPGQGTFALSITDLFSGPAVAQGPLGTGFSGPTYNAGYFVTDDIMPYGSLTISSAEDTMFLLRGGSRFYAIPGDTGSLRTFIDGELLFFSNGMDAVGLGGNFGMEYHVSRHFSVSGRVGLSLVNPDEGDTVFNLGTASTAVNFYF